MQFSTGWTFALFPGHTHEPSFCYQWLPRTWIWNSFGLTHGGQCKLTHDHPSAPPSGDGAQISLTHVLFAILHLEFYGTYQMLFQHPLQPLWLSDVGQREWFLAHMPQSPRCGRWTACLDGSSSKDCRPLFKRKYHSNVFNQFRQDSPKAACSISYVSAPFFPRRKWKLMHTRCWNFSCIVRCNTHCR